MIKTDGSGIYFDWDLTWSYMVEWVRFLLFNPYGEIVLVTLVAAVIWLLIARWKATRGTTFWAEMYLMEFFALALTLAFFHLYATRHAPAKLLPTSIPQRIAQDDTRA